jgi:hypothetical protein
MICLCRFPLTPQKFQGLEICSCNICHGLSQFSWRVLNQLPLLLPSFLEGNIQSFTSFMENLGQWIIKVAELEGNTPELLPLLHRKIEAYRQAQLGYLDLLFYPTENFAGLNEAFLTLQQNLQNRIQAVEEKVQIIWEQVPSVEMESPLRQLLFWSCKDYALTLQSLWEEATTNLKKESNAIL